MKKPNKQSWVYILLASLSLAVMAMGSIEDEEKACADQFTNLGACIPYVSGTAPKPTPQCCEDTKKVRNSQPKCLCVLIKESTDPSLGLPINTTLALKMPTACNIDAKVSDCPKILNLPDDSPDAKIFKSATYEDSSTSSTSDDSAVPSSSSSSSSDTTNTTNTNYGAKLGQNLAVAVGSSLLFFFF